MSLLEEPVSGIAPPGLLPPVTLPPPPQLPVAPPLDAPAPAPAQPAAEAPPPAAAPSSLTKESLPPPAAAAPSPPPPPAPAEGSAPATPAAPAAPPSPPEAVPDPAKKLQQLLTLTDVVENPGRVARRMKLPSVSLAPGDPVEKKKALDALTVDLFIRFRVGDKYVPAKRDFYRRAIAADMFGEESNGGASDAEFVKAAQPWATGFRAEHNLIFPHDTSEVEPVQRAVKQFATAIADSYRDSMNSFSPAAVSPWDVKALKRAD
ncbi:MAG TPA: hypothetical protein VHM91_08660, partial [Verrucomicrobiales bacterium]|nr:hypothetical protein [Verrucomicrobiales bacterium]